MAGIQFDEGRLAINFGCKTAVDKVSCERESVNLSPINYLVVVKQNMACVFKSLFKSLFFLILENAKQYNPPHKSLYFSCGSENEGTIQCPFNTTNFLEKTWI
jgi:hypothetical protein